MAGYKDFVKTTSNTVNHNNQDEKSKLKEENCHKLDKIDQNENNKLKEEDKEIIKCYDLNNHKKVETKDKKKKNHKSKVKSAEIEDLSLQSDEDSDVKVIKIMNPEKNDTKENKSELKTNKIDKNIKINTNAPQDKTNNIELIHTIAGTWHVSSDSIHNNSKTKQIHKDVENAFKNVETILKNKINKKLINLKNKVEIKQSSNKNLAKQKNQNLDNDTDYLKINNKCTKVEFNEPLYENNKTLGLTQKTNFENNQELNTKITEKYTKQVQDIDPNEFLQLTQTSLETLEMTQVEDHMDDKDENDQEKLIAEAFAEDDIINEFKYKL